MYYFAYGSNLNTKDLARYIFGRKVSVKSLKNIYLQKIGIAFLPDHKLAFNSYSGVRDGGVISVVESPGSVVPGVLYYISEEMELILDCKEGAFCSKRKYPGYRKIEKTIIVDGDYIDGYTYQYIDEYQEDYREIFKEYGFASEDFVKPSKEYLKVIIDGYREHNLTEFMEMLYAASTNGDYPKMKMFVYGSLMRGMGNHHISKHKDYEFESIQGYDLYSLGSFPAVIKGGLTVHGEAFCIEDDIHLDSLDSLEGFYGFSCDSNFYNRTIAKTDSGEYVWLYVLNEDSLKNERIDSGDWRKFKAEVNNCCSICCGWEPSEFSDIYEQGDGICRSIPNEYGMCKAFEYSYESKIS